MSPAHGEGWLVHLLLLHALPVTLPTVVFVK
jgi:hypothetical protein